MNRRMGKAKRAHQMDYAVFIKRVILYSSNGLCRIHQMDYAVFIKRIIPYSSNGLWHDWMMGIILIDEIANKRWARSALPILRVACLPFCLSWVLLIKWVVE
jgi:hypothetical protein